MAENAEASQSPLPALALHAKVVVFELQCPTCFRIWRSAAPRVLYCLQSHVLHDDSLSRMRLYSNRVVRPEILHGRGGNEPGDDGG